MRRRDTRFLPPRLPLPPPSSHLHIERLSWRKLFENSWWLNSAESSPTVSDKIFDHLLIFLRNNESVNSASQILCNSCVLRICCPKIAIFSRFQVYLCILITLFINNKFVISQ